MKSKYVARNTSLVGKKPLILPPYLLRANWQWQPMRANAHCCFVTPLVSHQCAQLSSQNWLEWIKTKMNVKVQFPLTEDLSMKIAKAYGMLDQLALTTAAVRGC